ncbi:Peptidoglycan-N-acetylglucosamine deacetylase [compost metagenome]
MILFQTGCSSKPYKPGESEYFEGIAIEASPTPAISDSAQEQSSYSPLAEATTTIESTPSPVRDPISNPSPSTISEPILTPSPQSVKPKATPKPPKFKSKQGQQDGSKKPSVPVHRNQENKAVQKSLSLSELVRKYPHIFKLHGSTQEKRVALTFDDGPDGQFTARVLDVLKQTQVKATFFVVGKQAQAYPDLVRRMVKEGHVVGNHSYTHANLPKLSESKFQEQIENTQSILQDLIGYTPKLIRPPYGAINEEQVRWVSSHHYVIVNWNVDSLDWKQLSSSQVLNNVMAQTRPGSIILQHSGGGEGQDLSGTVEALPTIISKLKASGYQLVTVPELLGVSKNK